MLLIRTKIVEHYRDDNGNTATLESRQDGATLTIVKSDSLPVSKDYKSRKGAAIALGRMYPGMKYICMVDHISKTKPFKRPIQAVNVANDLFVD